MKSLEEQLVTYMADRIIEHDQATVVWFSICAIEGWLIVQFIEIRANAILP